MIEQTKIENEKLKIIEKEKAKTKLYILRVIKSTNPFQNYLPSIRVEYKIVETEEIFADYITKSDKPISEYKTARFKLATDTQDIAEVFDLNFRDFKKKLRECI